MIERYLYSHISLRKLAKIIGAQLPDALNGNTVIGRVLTQPMYVSRGDAVISGWYPRKKTVSESLRKGALAVFCDEKVKASFPQENVIAVEDPFRCVYLYEQWRTRYCRAKRIVITGSVGKTTTTGLISTVIAGSFKTLTSESMANSHDAVLRNVQLLEFSHRYWIQEIGGVHPGYIASSAEFMRPDIVVLTNIGDSHLDLYGTRENILYDKLSMERYAHPDASVIINADDELLAKANYSHRVVRCSVSDPEADYYACDLRTELDGLHFTVRSEGQSRDVHLNLYGDHNAYNALFAIAAGRLAGIPYETILPRLETYQPEGMRQHLIRVGGYTLFADAFNAEPKTVLGAAETLAHMPVKAGGRRIFVTGHIDKLGAESAEKHAAIGRELAKMGLDLVVLYAGDSVHTYRAMKECGCDNVLLMQSREELDDWLERNITRKDVVFFKSGQFLASLGKSIDHVFGTTFQNKVQWNDGRLAESGGFAFRIRKDQAAEIERYTGTDSEPILPDHFEENTVVRIAPKAFAGNRIIQSADIPSSVRNIGSEAFAGCTELKRARLPVGLKMIEDGAFSRCTSLEEIAIPDGTIHIGEKAFAGCRKLKTVTLPSSVGYVGDNAFDAHVVLTSKTECP